MLTYKYPDGHWEEDSDRTCPDCGHNLQVFVTEEVSSTGRLIEYVHGERCPVCHWTIETN